MKNSITIVFIVFVIKTYAGGPWTPKKGGGYFQLQPTIPTGTYNELFLKNNKDLVLNYNVIDFNFDAYLEYGISDRLAFIGTASAKYVAVKNNTINKSLFAAGNQKLALKYKLREKKTLTSVSVNSEIYTSSANLNYGLSTGYLSNAIGVMLHYGGSINSKSYLFIEGGYFYRTHNYSDEIKITTEYGYKIKPKIWLAAVFDIKESTFNGSRETTELQQTGLYPNNQEYFAWGGKFIYESEKQYGLSISSFGAFSGNYVAHLATLNIGVYKKW
jgi:hypothetical protein